MKISVFFICVAMFLLSSCAKIPYAKWSGEFNQFEEKIRSVKQEADFKSSMDLMLYNGAYDATKKKDASPYPVLRKIAGTISSLNINISRASDSTLADLTNFHKAYENLDIKKRGKDFKKYELLQNKAMRQLEFNKTRLNSLNESDNEFDSICEEYKVRATPVLEYEVKLADDLAVLEERFAKLQREYQGFKTKITERKDRETSMAAINRMKMKIRQTDNEIFQLSNLYSRMNSLRGDAMIYEGPHIDQLAELKLMNQKMIKINGFLNELEKMIKAY